MSSVILSHDSGCGFFVATISNLVQFRQKNRVLDKRICTEAFQAGSTTNSLGFCSKAAQLPSLRNSTIEYVS